MYAENPNIVTIPFFDQNQLVRLNTHIIECSPMRIDLVTN